MSKFSVSRESAPEADLEPSGTSAMELSGENS